MAVDSEGMVYVADFNRGEVLKFTPEGNILLLLAVKEGNISNLVSSVASVLTPMTSCMSPMR